MYDKAYLETMMETIQAAWDELVPWLKQLWKAFNRCMRSYRHGTQAQRRIAWRLLHPPKKARRSRRRMQVAARRALTAA